MESFSSSLVWHDKSVSGSSERTIAGLEKARASGRVGGRPRLECDRGKVLKLHAAGKSLAAIAKELGISKTTAHRLVKRTATEETRCAC